MYFTEKKLSALIICIEREIRGDKYKNIIYNSLFFLINNLQKLPDNPETIWIWISNKNTFLFM